MLENVKIGNVNYSVEYVPLVSRFDTLRGEINYVNRNIRIEDSMTAEDTHETLLHEVIHGIDNFMEIGLTEEHVSKISKGIHMVMTDNPQLFRHPSVTSEIQEAVNHAAVHIVDDIRVSDKADIDRIVDRITEIMGNQIERNSPAVQYKAVILPPEEPVITTLSDFTTKALIEELQLRVGVKMENIEMGEQKNFTMIGPCIMLCVEE